MKNRKLYKYAFVLLFAGYFCIAPKATTDELLPIIENMERQLQTLKEGVEARNRSVTNCHSNLRQCRNSLPPSGSTATPSSPVASTSDPSTPKRKKWFTTKRSDVLIYNNGNYTPVPYDQIIQQKKNQGGGLKGIFSTKNMPPLVRVFQRGGEVWVQYPAGKTGWRLYEKAKREWEMRNSN